MEENLQTFEKFFIKEIFLEGFSEGDQQEVKERVEHAKDKINFLFIAT